MGTLPDEDIRQTLEAVPWESLKGARILITGGTGFFGSWLLESLLSANERYALGIETFVLSRNPQDFQRKRPELASKLHWIQGDVRSFAFPEGEFSHIIHAATEASAKLDSEAPEVMGDTILSGTLRVLEFAAQSKAKRVLFTSSGAVYGPQPSNLTHIPEKYESNEPLSSAYADGKRLAESLCHEYLKKSGVPIVTARCFAFVGPYLPLDIHYAVGNFIRDALSGGTIAVNGDGTPIRSYLYASDLAVWLWTLLIRGKLCYPYNVGSENRISIGELAKMISEITGVKFQIAKDADPNAPRAQYVPSTNRAREELGLLETVGLREAIERTLRWHQKRNGNG